MNSLSKRGSLISINLHMSFLSTETALLKIQIDISTSVNSGKAIALTLIDLSAVLILLITPFYIIV